MKADDEEIDSDISGKVTSRDGPTAVWQSVEQSKRQRV